MSAGTVWIVGAGPGDPELLTVKAKRILERADVVLYDRLVSQAILNELPEQTKKVYVGKNHGEQDSVQTEIMTLLLQYAQVEQTVVRLKGGDPFIFGRGAEEWAWLIEHGINVQVIPGISSSLAGPALAGIPLTYRFTARNFAVITGHKAILEDSSPTDWQSYASIDTLVILMGVGTRQEIAQELIRAGRKNLTPCAFIEQSSTPQEKVILTSLEEIAAGATSVKSPAVWVIGEVVKVRQQLIPVSTP
jgi:uroporphyrin-III C-methyltransferase